MSKGQSVVNYAKRFLEILTDGVEQALLMELTAQDLLWVYIDILVSHFLILLMHRETLKKSK